MKFPLGQVVWTSTINEKIADDTAFAKFIWFILHRHSNCDWGDLDAHDIKENELGLKYGYRLFSAYDYASDNLRVWVITEADRSSTCILFPDEY